MNAKLKENIAKTNVEQIITINPELDKYYGQILFPEKLELAEKHLKGIDMSVIINHRGK